MSQYWLVCKTCKAMFALILPNTKDSIAVDKFLDYIDDLRRNHENHDLTIWYDGIWRAMSYEDYPQYDQKEYPLFQKGIKPFECPECGCEILSCDQCGKELPEKYICDNGNYNHFCSKDCLAKFKKKTVKVVSRSD